MIMGLSSHCLWVKGRARWPLWSPHIYWRRRSARLLSQGLFDVNEFTSNEDIRNLKFTVSSAFRPLVFQRLYSFAICQFPPCKFISHTLESSIGIWKS